MLQKRGWILALLLTAMSPRMLCAQQMPGLTGAPTVSGEKNSTPPVCPGGFPTDLTVINCLYTMKVRGDAFIENSVTDKSILNAVVFGAGAQVVQSPGEWKRTWDGYGRRVGVRYNQAVAKGAAEFLVGAMMRDDPRNISYRDDPHVVGPRQKAVKNLSESKPSDTNPYAEAPHASIGKRIGHAFFDSITVRRSSLDGNGRRLPALSRLVGAYASGYGGYAWYKAPENTFKNAGLRAAQSFGTDVGASFYTEFAPDVTRLAGAIFKRGRQSKTAPTPTSKGSVKNAISANEVTAP